MERQVILRRECRQVGNIYFRTTAQERQLGSQNVLLLLHETFLSLDPENFEHAFRAVYELRLDEMRWTMGERFVIS